MINAFTENGIPILCIHDSFIVDYSRVIMLKEVMAWASEKVVGRAIPVTSYQMGLDEVEEKEPERVEGYIEMRQQDPTPQYLARQHLFSERALYLHSLS